MSNLGVRQYNQTKICHSMPPNINSFGILQKNKPPVDFFTYSLPLLELQMGIILLMINGFYLLFKRFGATKFICQVLTGIILGPAVLGRCKFMREVIFPRESQQVISEAALFGFTMYIFISGVKIDTESAKRSTGKLAIITGFVSVLIPLALGSAFLAPFYTHLKSKNALYEAFSVVIMNCFSTYSVVGHFLEEVKLLNSEIGSIIIPSALVAAFVSVLLIIASGIYLSGKVALFHLGACVGFMIVCGFLFRPLFLCMIKKSNPRSRMNSSFTYLVAAMALASEAYFRIIHQLPGIGPFTLGIFVPAGPSLGSAIIDMFETFCYSVFMPLAVVIVVMTADLPLVMSHFAEIKLYLIIMVFIGVIKLVACVVPLLYWEIQFLDSVLLAMIMTSRGFIELGLFMFARDFLLISEPVFGLMVLYLFLSSTIFALSLKQLYDPEKKFGCYHARNFMSLKPNSMLRLVACVHKPENVNSITRLIDSFHPCKERFIDLHVLHLVKLGALNSPVIISHDKHKPITDSLSQDIIIFMNQHEQNNWQGISVSTHTVMSPIISMIEDISIFAFDQYASLILLPFHRKWSIHGHVESEDNSIRTINCKVLERAPCSVGIFFDRGKLGRQSSKLSSRSPISICLVFLGGCDDREALSLAKQMTCKESTSNLTVMHFALNKPETTDSEEANLDYLAIEDIKPKSNDSSDNSSTSIEYKYQLVKDGAETALAIRSIVDEYDLFLVGRRYGVESPHTIGLSEWTELPELGVIGDMLASNHINTRAAVLVVQQQRKMK